MDVGLIARPDEAFAANSAQASLPDNYCNPRFAVGKILLVATATMIG